jgi:pyruvate/2-oxoglutarate dehydrogenase complex dihydrolipoamide dehydrogenase (E3) component
MGILRFAQNDVGLKEGKHMAENFDVVVIGAGTAGLVTASGCARLGRKTALIEREEREALGGDCLWTGCVPTKALVASAKLAHQMRHAADYGLEPVEVRITPRSVMESMRDRRRYISKHDHPDKFRKLGVDVIQGNARFVSPREVEVGDRRLVAKDIVIATGSRTFIPPVEGLAETGYLDHASFLDQDEFPKSVIILGGGAIGTEFSQILRRFGCEVTLVEMGRGIISREDKDVSARLHEILEKEGVRFRSGWGAKKVWVENGSKRVRIESKEGQIDEIEADEIFVASGRRGNIEGLDLEAAGVETERSYVVADKYLQTSVPRIWACGDIHGKLQFTHVAAFEAVKLVRNILFPGKSAISYDHIPWGVYTDPEVGRIGVTEEQAVAEHGRENVKVFKVEMDDVDRAVVDRSAKGFLKFVCDPKGRILGAHAFCANASTLIEEIVLARKKGVRISELAQLVSPYPSLADSVQKTASLYYQDLSSSWVGSLGKRIAAWSQ